MSGATAVRFESAKSWPGRRLSDVATLLPSHSVATAGDVAVVVVTTACLTESAFNPTGVKAARMRAEDVAGATLSPGEVLIARSNTSELVGRVAMYRGGPPGAVASDLTIRVRTGQQLEAAFLSRYLSALFLTGYWREKAGGASGSMKKITRAQMSLLEVPVPAMTIQRAVVVSVDKALAEVERARAAAEASLEAAAAVPDAFLRDVFHSTKASAWPVQRIRELGDPTRADVVQTGPFGAQLPSSAFVPEGVPVLNVGNVRWGRLDLSSLDHVGVEKANDLARYRLQRGDVLFTRSGSVGRCAVVPPEVEGWLMSYHLLRVAIDQHRIEPEYLAAAIRGAPEVRRQVLVASKRGSTRDGVNTEFLSELLVPLPDYQEQLRIARDLQGQMAAAERLRNSAEMDLAAINALPAALLRQAFSGEL